MEHLLWIAINIALLAWNWHQPSSTLKGVVLALLAVSTLVNLVALYGYLHTL